MDLANYIFYDLVLQSLNKHIIFFIYAIRVWQILNKGKSKFNYNEVRYNSSNYIESVYRLDMNRISIARNYTLFKRVTKKN